VLEEGELDHDQDEQKKQGSGTTKLSTAAFVEPAAPDRSADSDTLTAASVVHCVFDVVGGAQHLGGDDGHGGEGQSDE